MEAGRPLELLDRREPAHKVGGALTKGRSLMQLQPVKPFASTANQLGEEH